MIRLEIIVVLRGFDPMKDYGVYPYLVASPVLPTKALTIASVLLHFEHLVLILAATLLNTP